MIHKDPSAPVTIPRAVLSEEVTSDNGKERVMDARVSPSGDPAAATGPERPVEAA